MSDLFTAIASFRQAYAGFSWGVASGSWESIATGNWGCGAYRGDANLKTLLQLMAAAVTGRDMAYFTFGNTELRDKLADMHSFLVKHQVTVGKYWGCGAYRGDANLKTLLQLMAAAVTGRDMAYFTFGNTELRDKLADMHSFLVKHQVTVGKYWDCGAYRGDANPKTLLQLMAAAVTGRDMAYFTFGNTELRVKLADMHSFLVKHQVTVGKYWGCGAYKGDANFKILQQLMAAAVTGRDMAYFTFGNTELRDWLA
ncbi:hypothetical protein J6590_034898 [Homalodisca vitripennis]|nr:hypothetical protein J6590_034898 [Homalodisca vitripennis]